MTSDRWREVSRIYDALLTKAPGVRAAALDKLYAHHDTVRREVEAPLADDSAAAGLDGGVAFLVTELVQGDSLTVRLERGPFPFEQALQTAGEM
jgi:hypothetical protein